MISRDVKAGRLGRHEAPIAFTVRLPARLAAALDRERARLAKQFGLPQVSRNDVIQRLIADIEVTTKVKDQV